MSATRSETSFAQSKGHAGRLTKFWIGIAIIVAIAIALAWLGAGSLRGQTFASGLGFRTIAPGTGPMITANDGVLIDYEGRLPDGTVFDSNAGRGPQPLIAGQTIPGFAEALTHMQKGGSYRVHIPAKLAYGATPPQGSSIPPNADLDFDVHVVQVVPNAALMTGAGGAGDQSQAGAEGAPQGQEMPQGEAPPQGQELPQEQQQ